MPSVPASRIEPSGNFLGFLPLREFFSLDIRSLALLRVGMAVMLILDWLDRLPDLSAHYSDTGIVPRNIITGMNPVSIHMFSGEVWFQAVLAGIALVFAFLLLVGWRTPFVSLISWFLLISIHSRCPPVMQGGDHLLRMMLFWSIFLPLGACYSVDSSTSPSPPTPLPRGERGGSSSSPPAPFPSGESGEKRVLSPASVAYIVQLCLVYWYAASWKWAPEWREQGSAVYLALQSGYFTTRFAQFLLGFPELLRYFTFASLWLEALGPAVLFFPFAPAFQRLLVISAFITFHVGLALSLELSTFPWVCCVAWLALLPTPFWDRIAAQLRRNAITGMTILYDADRSPRPLACLRTFLLLGDVLLEPAHELPDLLRRIRREGGWGVMDSTGNLHCGLDALVLLVRLSPLTSPFSFLFRLPPVRWLGSQFSRLLAGRVRRERPREQSVPTWAPPGGLIGNTIIIFCLVVVVLFNIRTLGRGMSQFQTTRGFKVTDNTADALRIDKVPEEVVQKLRPLKDKSFATTEEFQTELKNLLDQKELERFQNVILARSYGIQEVADKFEWLFPNQAAQFTAVIGLEQGWGLFAPRPGLAVGWQLVIGKQKNGNEIDLVTGGPVNREKPTLQAATYPNGRWRKMMMNLTAPHLYPYLPAGMALYYFRHWNATHDGTQQLKSVEIVWMKEETRPYGETPPPIQPLTLITYEEGTQEK
jgi:hypothetical protein